MFRWTQSSRTPAFSASRLHFTPVLEDATGEVDVNYTGLKQYSSVCLLQRHTCILSPSFFCEGEGGKRKRKRREETIAKQEDKLDTCFLLLLVWVCVVNFSSPEWTLQTRIECPLTSRERISREEKECFENQLVLFIRITNGRLH